MWRSIITWAIIFLFNTSLFASWPKEQRHYWDVVMPIMRTHCNTGCHNADDKKGGLNLNRYDFIKTIKRDGHVFVKVIEHVENGTMPPEGKAPLTKTEKDTLLHYIKKYLNEALHVADPGLIAPRRLSNREYGYAIQDLTGIKIDTDSIFPRDPGGGEGFDNFALSLYLTPLLMERYFDVASYVVDEWGCTNDIWETENPSFKLSRKDKFKIWWHKWWHKKDLTIDLVTEHARSSIIPFATLAFRRHLGSQERENLLQFFRTVFLAQRGEEDNYKESLKEVFKAILVSNHFLMRQEADPTKEKPYLISNFELATRLSFFLWSSIPDFELLEAAYRSDLHDPKVLNQQIRRMLNSPKVKRMAESFATQWLDIDLLKDPTHEIDTEIFPEYNEPLKKALHQEAVEYFHYTLTKSRNWLELLDGQYAFLNEPLAKHYGIDGVKGKEMRKVDLGIHERGGVLSMGGVLTATSLPNRTSPVLRGKWVMEKILATPAKPPPPNVPELEDSKKTHDEMSLRELLVIHRENPACIGCHQDMDDLGFALDNFDATGKWRDRYSPNGPIIDVSGSLKSGEQFTGPVELKKILVGYKDKFAKSLSKKMLGFALGRSIEFKDSKTIDHLANTLLKNNFDPVPFIQELAYSYPFRYKKSDPVVVDNNFGS